MSCARWYAPSGSFGISETKIPVRSLDETTNFSVTKQPILKVWELRLDEKGQLPDLGYEHRDITKMDLAAELGVALRDLRSITETSTYRRRIATIITRPHVIIFHIEPVQAIIQYNRVMLFNLGRADPLLAKVKARLPWRINKSTASTFEFKVLEALLIELVEQMDETARELEPVIEEILQKLIEGRQKTEDLLNLKNHTDRLNAFEAHVLEVVSAIMQVLENDEDMAAMYLTNAHRGKKQDIKDHDEVETMMEVFQQQVTEIDNRITLIKTKIKTTEDYLKINIDGIRNRLIRTNLWVSIISFGVTVCAAGASIFGMNIEHGLEKSPYAFPFVVSGLLGVALISTGTIYWLMFPRFKDNTQKIQRVIEKQRLKEIETEKNRLKEQEKKINKGEEKQQKTSDSVHQYQEDNEGLPIR